MNKKKVKYKELSATAITADALLMLKARNCFCWRQPNNSGKRWKNNVKKGVSDILGYNKRTAIAVYVEVKKNGDVLSEDQYDLMHDAYKAGCFVMVAHQVNDKTVLSDFVLYALKNYKPEKVKK